MSMKEEDLDEERGRLETGTEQKRKSRLVGPRMLKVILTVGPVVAKILRLGIELVKLFKD
jgi:hypothetical protein